MKILNQVQNYIKEFGEVTTLHGFRYLVSEKIHWIERLVWILTIVAATLGSVLLIRNNWIRYHINPTVISLQKNYRTWKLPFPAATVCFVDKLNTSLATDYIEKNWSNENHTIFEYYKQFLNTVANEKYENIRSLLKYSNDLRLNRINLMKLAREVMIKINYHATIFNPKYKNISFIETISEMGFCYTYNGVLSRYLTLQSDDNINGNLTPPTCSFSNSLCYARIEDLPASLNYYVHSPYEIPDIRAKHFNVKSNMERDTAFRYIQTIASKELKLLRPEQRKCRFFDEPLKGWKVPKYSYNLCLMECRKRLASKLCGCIPHFYRDYNGIPICDLNGLACLAPYIGNLITLKLYKESPKCKCLPTCYDLNLFIDKDMSREWSYPVPSNIRFRYAIEMFSKTRLKREIIFGVQDLLEIEDGSLKPNYVYLVVSLGGTAALFLGCSLLTFIEIFYFITLRLFWRIFGKQTTS